MKRFSFPFTALGTLLLLAGTLIQVPAQAASFPAFINGGEDGLTEASNDLVLDSVRLHAANGIQADDLSRHLSILAGDSLAGRETGTVGQQRAAAYLARQFDAMGLQPAGENGGWFQSFELSRTGWGNVELSIDGQAIEFLEDFYGWPGSNDPVVIEDAPMVFAGYGIDDPMYSDYGDMDVRGKVVLINAGEPEDKEGNYHLTGTGERSDWTTDWRKKIGVATERGALALVVVSKTAARQLEMSSFVEYIGNPSMELAGPEEPSGYCNTLYITPSTGGIAFGSLKKYEKTLAKINKKLKPAPMELDARFSLVVEKERENVMSENVLAMIPGSDLADELVFVTAHYDHLGQEGDKIYNGADDDGSGTVAVLEVAEALATAARNGHSPRRAVVFMTVSGEEKGLLGSEFYTDNPLFPLEQTVTNLNIDMVGRIDKKHTDDPEYVYLIGSDFLSSDLHAISEAAASRYSPLQLDYTYNSKTDPNRFYYRSDHYNFAKNGIPVIFYMNGSHDDYHQETDTVEKIAFDVLAERARLVFHTLWDVANRDERPVVDKPVDDE